MGKKKTTKKKDPLIKKLGSRKKIGENMWTLRTRSSTISAADSRATTARNRGESARVVKEGKGYSVYTRKKTKKVSSVRYVRVYDAHGRQKGVKRVG